MILKVAEAMKKHAYNWEAKNFNAPENAAANALVAGTTAGTVVGGVSMGAVDLLARLCKASPDTRKFYRRLAAAVTGVPAAVAAGGFAAALANGSID